MPFEEYLNRPIEEMTELLQTAADSVIEEGQLINLALRVASEAHSGQTRDEGTPYLIHPLRIASMLFEELEIVDARVLAAALLHDVLEDSDTTAQQLSDSFGETVAQWVQALTKPPKSSFASKADLLETYIVILRKAAPEVRLVKAADRLDNIRSLVVADNPKKVSRYLQETRKYYLDLAKGADLRLLEQLSQAVAIVEGG